MTEIARLRVEIEEVEPAVIRWVEVPLDIRLDQLNVVLQVAIGWQNCHPFEFRHGDTVYGLVSREAETIRCRPRRRRWPTWRSSAAPSTTTTCSATTGSTR